MEWRYTEKLSGALLHLMLDDAVQTKAQQGAQYTRGALYTLVFNTGSDTELELDGIRYVFPSGAFVPIMFSQRFRFLDAQGLVMWQFNREFYCIVNHDHEVGCAGFLFYGSWGPMILLAPPAMQRKCALLVEVFKEEFDNNDTIQGGMLRMLLVRLIILLTRLAKEQMLQQHAQQHEEKFQLLRQYNLLVELHYKQEHEVSFYAAKLFKSPKTLANAFARFGTGTPSQILHNRLLVEAKRCLQYGASSIKEIAFALGFEDAGHFSRFFKNLAGLSPSDYRMSIQQAAQ